MSPEPDATPRSPTVIVVMGSAGAGKTTVGKRLADALGWQFLEADELHPPGNIEKMRRGVSLNDQDRAPWLERLRARIERHLADDLRAVVACSALKRGYRERLRVDPRRVRFVYLKGDYALLYERLRMRRGHYMKASMLRSQLVQLEEPVAALVVNAARPVEETVAAIRATLAV